MLQLRNEVYEILKNLQVCNFSTINEKGNPWVRYVFAQADEELNIRFASCVSTRKMSHIQKNKNVHLSCGVQGMSDMMKPYLQIEGVAEIHTSKRERELFWNESLESLFSGPSDPDYAVIKVVPTKIECLSIMDQKSRVLDLMALQNLNKEYFNTNAKEWDGMRSDFFPGSVRTFAVDRVGVTSGDVAADVGAGSGFITHELVARGLNVYAIDHSAPMLEEIRNKYGIEGKVKTLLGESESLPLDTGVVDYAFANMFLHHVQNPYATILEMVRILKPGGKMCITDLDRHTFQFLIDEHYDRLMGFDRADIEEWFTMAGLDAIQIECVPGSCKAHSESNTQAADVSIFCVTGTKKK